jgi:hypothetical protein
MNQWGFSARSPPAQGIGGFRTCIFEKLRTLTNRLKGRKMRILFINNLGGGFADYINIQEGTTIEKLFKERMPHEDSADHLIRVNRQPVPKDYVLQ